MLLFWVIVIVMIVATLALILPALLKPSQAAMTDAIAEKRAIFRQQFDEIAQDNANGILDATQYDVAKSELERRMLDEIGTSSVLTSSSKPDRRLAALLLVLLPLAALVIYNKIGSPESIIIPAVSPLASSTATPAPESAQTAEHKMGGDIEPLLSSLKSKLEKNPGDGAGWALLARSYVELKRHAEAVPAYEKAVKVIQDDPQLLADYADALAVVNGHNLAGKPEELANQALKLDPHHTKALLLAATAAFNRKDYKVAITHWEQLQQDLPADSDVLPEVKASLSEVYALAGVKPPEASSAQAVVKSSAPAQMDAASAGVSGTVRIAPALASKLDPAATVFVFARATNGPPMPLAIVRTTAKDLPYTYHLDDSSALMPSNKLSQASEVMIVARVSKTGDAKSQSGDLQGISAAIKPVGNQVDIEINQVLP
jgi:cytochrome c-type biogenesis protein CcmH